MRLEGNDTETGQRPGYAVVETANPSTADPLPFLALAPIFRDILANAHRLPDAELIRVAGCLRTMADEVMAVVDRRHGSRPAPRLVIDNTRR